MNVLICCEESQAICKAYRELSINAFSCDLQKCSGGHPEWHIFGDVLPFLDSHRYNKSIPFFTQNGDLHFTPGRWDLIIAHPPCTFLARSSAVELSKNPIQRYNKLISARNFFMEFFTLPGRVVIENPVPLKIANLPPYSQIIQPYEFGDSYTKQTCLWLINVPFLIPNCYALPGSKRNLCTSWCSVRSGSKYRSKTFNGIAYAMANQWRFNI